MLLLNWLYQTKLASIPPKVNFAATEHIEADNGKVHVYAYKFTKASQMLIYQMSFKIWSSQCSSVYLSKICQNGYFISFFISKCPYHLDTKNNREIQISCISFLKHTTLDDLLIKERYIILDSFCKQFQMMPGITQN